MPGRPIHIRSTLAVFTGVSAASVEQRPAIGGAAQPVNSGCCRFPLYRSGVSELTTINKPDRTFITHSDRLLTFTANGTRSPRRTASPGS
jgi:hypothetical protein